MMMREFEGKELSLLGFGAMRLPQTPDGAVDEDAVHEMVRYAHEHGVNYYDTAYPYHDGASERVLGRALKPFPRDSFYLATKYPGHQFTPSYDPKATFEKQLEKCGVDYFDFYLLHNVCEISMDTYLDPRWGIIDYLAEQRKNGRIRRLGFSSHGTVSNIAQFLDLHGDLMEFCQIQVNYLDWTLQDAKAKFELLNGRGIPIWAMEPVRGGALAKLPEPIEQKLRAARPEESTAAWAFRWLQARPEVRTILSGMSNLEQVKDNVKTFSEERPLRPEEIALLEEAAAGMLDLVPCTACRYCCAECPQELDIPALLKDYNEARFATQISLVMRLEAMPEEKHPSACISCGKCSKMCPQKIDIPAALKEFTDKLSGLTSWEEVCKQRAAAQVD